MTKKENAFSRLELLKNIRDAAYLEGDFTTRAGKKTTYYIDKYLFETRPEILSPLADHLAKLFPDPSTYDRIAAPELGAVPIATLLSIRLKKPFLIVKKAGKDYGTSKLIEGSYDIGERVVLVEDILTTGGAVLRAAGILLDHGLDVHSIIGIINREEGALDALAHEGFSSVSVLFTASDLRSVKA